MADKPKSKPIVTTQITTEVDSLDNVEQLEKRKLICPICGFANDNNISFCKMCSNILINLRREK